MREKIREREREKIRERERGRNDGIIVTQKKRAKDENGKEEEE